MDILKSVLFLLLILFQTNLFAQARLCFEQTIGSADLPEFNFTYIVRTTSASVPFEPVKDGDCWLLEIPDFDHIQYIEIEISYDEGHYNGLTIFDLIAMANIITGQDTNNCSNSEFVVKRIAADVNNSGSISTFDWIQLRQLLIRVIPEFPNNNSWRFVNGNGLRRADKNLNFDRNNIFKSLGGFDSVLRLRYYPDEFSKDLIVNAIKVGDLNGPCN